MLGAGPAGFGYPRCVPGGHILVVDDDNVLRASIARILEEEGYTVDDAADGASALDKLGSGTQPDAILLDVMMPGMNGRQFLDELRSRVSRPVPVVVMTALQGMGVDRMISLGANDLVEKPFDVEELLNKVALALFRAGEYDTVADRPSIQQPARSPVQPEKGGNRSVLVVFPDREALGSIDAALSSAEYTVVSMTRPTDELARLARALDPAAVVLYLADADELLTLRRLRTQTELDGVPILACASPRFLERHRETVESMFAAAVDVAGEATEVAETVVELVRAPPARSRVSQRD